MKKETNPGELFNKHKTMKKEHSAAALKGLSKFVQEEKKEKGKKVMKKTAAIKKTGTFKGKSNKLGGGGRFAQVAAKAGGGAKGAAIAAAVGRKSLGKAKFQELAAKGKKRVAKKSTCK